MMINQTKRGFVQISNAIFTHYNFYPKYNGTSIQVYGYLTKLNNSDYGYAFPTNIQVMRDLGISDKTFNNAVKTLVACGLVTVCKHKGAMFHNNLYYVHEPIEDMTEFFAKYPEAKEVWEAKQATVDKVARRKSIDKEAYKDDQTVAKSDVDAVSEWL